jgi:single-stranded DNA-binding protein
MCEKYLTKGDKIYVEGRIKSRQWQTEDGTVKHTTEIQVTEFTFYRLRRGVKTTKKFSPLNRQTLTLTHKITAYQSMICRFDCLTNLLIWTQSPV